MKKKCCWNVTESGGGPEGKPSILCETTGQPDSWRQGRYLPEQTDPYLSQALHSGTEHSALFSENPSMWGCQTTDSSANKKQMASSQDRATILQPSPKINTISLWMMKRWEKGNPGPCTECALGKVKCLFRHYNFSVDILSKRKHLWFSLQFIILPNLFTGYCGLSTAGSWAPHIACSLLPHFDRGRNWKSRSEKTCGLR